jgi:hypothetical protein
MTLTGSMTSFGSGGYLTLVIWVLVSEMDILAQALARLPPDRPLDAEW